VVQDVKEWYLVARCRDGSEIRVSGIGENPKRVRNLKISTKGESAKKDVNAILTALELHGHAYPYYYSPYKSPNGGVDLYHWYAALDDSFGWKIVDTNIPAPQYKRIPGKGIRDPDYVVTPFDEEAND